MKIKWEKPDIVDQASYLNKTDYKDFAKQIQALGVAEELQKVNNKNCQDHDTLYIPISRNFCCHLF